MSVEVTESAQVVRLLVSKGADPNMAAEFVNIRSIFGMPHSGLTNWIRNRDAHEITLEGFQQDLLDLISGK